jgi:hypothetical protein
VCRLYLCQTLQNTLLSLHVLRHGLLQTIPDAYRGQVFSSFLFTYVPWKGRYIHKKSLKVALTFIERNLGLDINSDSGLSENSQLACKSHDTDSDISTNQLLGNNIIGTCILKGFPLGAIHYVLEAESSLLVLIAVPLMLAESLDSCL